MTATPDTDRITQPATPDEQRADEELIMFLERDQLVLDKARPVPRARLSARANTALWALRVFVVVVSAMVIYTFVSQIGH